MGVKMAAQEAFFICGTNFDVVCAKKIYRILLREVYANSFFFLSKSSYSRLALVIESKI